MTVNEIVNPESDATAVSETPTEAPGTVHALEARGLVKTFGHVVGLVDVDIHVDAGEVIGVIGDNGAGKSTLIKCLTGALTPDSGEVLLEGKPVTFKSPLEARLTGIETVYQTLAVAPALDIASNIYLGREVRKKGVLGTVFRALDRRGMRNQSKEQLSHLGISTVQDITQRLETLSGGQRQAVAVARAAAFGTKVIVLDEPTAALGVKEGNQVLDLIKRLKEEQIAVILISHNMPHVWEVADRVHIQRLGRCVGTVRASEMPMEDAVAVMTGAKVLPPSAEVPA